MQQERRSRSSSVETSVVDQEQIWVARRRSLECPVSTHDYHLVREDCEEDSATDAGTVYNQSEVHLSLDTRTRMSTRSS